MSRMKLAAGVLAAALAWLISPYLFAEFAPVREKVVRTEIAASAGQVRVPIPDAAALKNLRSPFALIASVRNDEAAALVIRIAIDDHEVCAGEVAAGASRRIDCAVRDPWTGGPGHSVLFSTTAPGFRVEYLELATHFGSLTPGPRNLIIGPTGFRASRPSSTWNAVVVFVLLMFSSWSVLDRRLPRIVSAVHLGLTVMVALLVAVVIVSGWVSPYSLLISHEFLTTLLLWTALPALLFAAHAVVVRLRGRPTAQAIAVGAVTGALFLSFAVRQVTERYESQVSGLLVISNMFFDKSPMALERSDIAPTLRFSDGSGYDGQFFYFMTFDPFLENFRNDPVRYREYIDYPPYRYGRIGFSLLTKALSLNRSALYPVAMVALVIASLALCGVLLAMIAERHGWSSWFGLLTVLIPGFRQTVDWTLPEPLAVALVLGAYLCLVNQRWWAGAALLSACMLVRETSGVFVVALAAGVFVAGKRREAAIISLIAFVPVLLWKMFVGSVFWPVYGLEGVMPHPDDLGLPFAGVWQLWSAMARGDQWDRLWESARAGVAYSILTTAAATLAWIAAIRRPNPVAVTAAVYGLLTIAYNYEAVWLAVANAQRLTIDLFVALALVFLQPAGRRVLVVPFIVFWCATAWYVFFGSYDTEFFRGSLLAWLY